MKWLDMEPCSSESKRGVQGKALPSGSGRSAGAAAGSATGNRDKHGPRLRELRGSHWLPADSETSKSFIPDTISPWAREKHFQGVTVKSREDLKGVPPDC